MAWFALNEPICRRPAVNTCFNDCNASYPPTLLFTSKRPSLKKRPWCYWAWEFGCMMKICKQNHILYGNIYSNCYCQGEKGFFKWQVDLQHIKAREGATSLLLKVKMINMFPFNASNLESCLYVFQRQKENQWLSWVMISYWPRRSGYIRTTSCASWVASFK